MQTLSEIKALLTQRGIRPKHRLGQNFLHDQNLLRKLVDASGVGTGDLVLEVGPGTGTLTSALLDLGANVVACELDRDMASIIRDEFGDDERLRLLEGDCLASKHRLSDAIVDAVGGRTFRLVANLPYQAASPLIATLLQQHEDCIGMYITIQKEVADRITAQPGGRDYGALTVMCQAMAEIERIAVCPPSCFWPAPKVTSAMIALTRRFTIDFDPGALAALTQRLFQKRRKQLGAILGREFPLPDGVGRAWRPEDLSIEQFIELSRLHGKGSDR
jgi:16S rRNA (adenine1518-N6/adenine1519-N6)-dimethyltransferase